MQINARSKEKPPLNMQTGSIRAKVDKVLVWISWSMQILEHFNSFLPEPV